MRETRRATEWHRLLSGRVARAEGSDNEIVIWDNDFDNDDFSFSSRPHRLYPVASLLTNPNGPHRLYSVASLLTNPTGVLTVTMCVCGRG